MSEDTKTQAEPQEAPTFNPDAGIAGAAAFADAETQEILNLLGETGDSAGGCCGGSCCSV